MSVGLNMSGLGQFYRETAILVPSFLGELMRAVRRSIDGICW